MALTVAASATASVTASKLYGSTSHYSRRLSPPNKAMASTTTTITKASFFVTALKQDKDTNDRAFTSKVQDLAYLGKLATGSIVGAGVIKYGSIVFPEITKPNLTQALFIILSPVIIAVLLLINQSRKDKPS
ncbi:hypothetical protein F8388_026997 [Cannabis sativa]|uniref:Uncharacterized protein n=1 Tax=Cannabis sativa TaxID=3483 RepID=A0A7J6FNP0_CANSA|nr:hypothetical protein F8388_026997 [Cannabis sativa]KAF4387740.1 hypothetical protein G4B88_004067 [Cannabis sativa]